MNIRMQSLRAAAMIAICWGGVATAAAQSAASPPDTPLDGEVDRILTRLEERHINDLRARIVWELRYPTDEPEDAERKFGELWYRDEQPVAKFKAAFDEKIVGDTKRRLDEQHLFDGRWYHELRSETKTVTRREIRRESDPNPYKLGEGAFPLPFGQKKVDIVREFSVAIVPPAAGDPQRVDHLKLTPRTGGQMDAHYKEIEFWIGRADAEFPGLPVKVRTAKKDGTGAINSYITVTFSKIELNAGFAGNVFNLATPIGFDEVKEPIDAPSGAVQPP